MCDHKELRPDIEILPQATEQVKGHVFLSAVMIVMRQLYP